MTIIYDSLTGQAKRLADQLGFKSYDIKDYDETDISCVFLITRSYNFGEIPETTQQFLSKYHQHVIGVAVSGNRNWGQNFGAAGVKIEKKYGIPLVLKFEGSGMPGDAGIIKSWIHTYLAQQK
ncbi:MAG: class Ib ribonucleoside-diphosphate reductase assembly flavoprotein NrdI [Acholeplasmataceae bacterium]